MLASPHQVENPRCACSVFFLERSFRRWVRRFIVSSRFVASPNSPTAMQLNNGNRSERSVNSSGCNFALT